MSTKNDEKGFVTGCDEQCKQMFIKKIADFDKQNAPTMRINGYKWVDSSERTVLFTFGEITFPGTTNEEVMKHVILLMNGLA